MSPEKQRIAIAKACGWTRVNIDEPMSGYAPNQGMPGLCKIPDYVNDLNAMHDAFSSLGTINKIRLHAHLEQIAKLSPDIAGEDFDYKVSNATAAQRAEAFLKSLNLWEENE